VTGGLVVVEFVGSPGAGKTTAAAVLTRMLRERGATARSMVEAGRPHAGSTTVGALAAALPRSVGDPVLWQLYRLHGWREARAVRPSALGRHVTAWQSARPVDEAVTRHTLGWFFRLAGRMRFLERTATPGEILVVDDGFLHRSVALHASPHEAVDPAAVAAFVDLIPAATLAVLVRAPVDVCAARVRARGLWAHRAGWSDADLDAYLANAAAVVDAAVGRVRALGRLVVDVDNGAADASPADLEAALAPVAAELLERRATVPTGGAA
jgi:thymidylate kinase